MWHGLLYNFTVHDAAIRCDVDCLLQMAYEQRSWSNDVFPLFRLRCRFAYVRIQISDLSVLNENKLDTNKS